jgi:hypothetical protein
MTRHYSLTARGFIPRKVSFPFSWRLEKFALERRGGSWKDVRDARRRSSVALIDEAQGKMSELV